MHVSRHRHSHSRPGHLRQAPERSQQRASASFCARHGASVGAALGTGAALGLTWLAARKQLAQRALPTAFGVAYAGIGAGVCLQRLARRSVASGPSWTGEARQIGGACLGVMLGAGMLVKWWRVGLTGAEVQACADLLSFALA
jgi:hypothetical protein